MAKFDRPKEVSGMCVFEPELLSRNKDLLEKQYTL